MTSRSSDRTTREPRAATLVLRRDLTANLAIFRFELEGGVPEFEAGQFVLLGLPEDDGGVVWRAYSIASPPEQRDTLELYVRLVDLPGRGRFTKRLWRLAAGDQLQWKPPRGRFTVADRHPDGTPDERDLVFVASGTGLAPLRSTALHLRHVGTRRRVLIAHGASHAEELGYAEELAALDAESRAAGPQGWWFRYLPTISRPNDPRNAGWAGHTGRVSSLLERNAEAASPVERALGGPLVPGAVCLYVCGLDGTLRAVLDQVEPLGFRTHANPRDDGSFDLHQESYGKSDTARSPRSGPN